MRIQQRAVKTALYTLAAAFATVPMLVSAQPRTAGVDFSSAEYPPTNALPNPYLTHEDWFRMPEDREWGSTSAIDISPDGQYIWVGERCSANIAGCTQNPELDPVLKFDRQGNLVDSFGAGMIAWPHGIDVDDEGNVWIADARDNQYGDNPPDEVIGHQVHKFSADGEHLMALGVPGSSDVPGELSEPNDVIVGPDGNIYVGEGHSNSEDTPSRVVVYNSDGEYLRHFGEYGSEPGQFIQPHSLQFDSQDRLFVADRSNARIQIFNTDGELLDVWYQFSRISGLYIDDNDTLYAADSESGSVAPDNVAWMRGIRVGSAQTGEVHYLIPDPRPDCSGTCAAEGVVADREGIVYGAEVGPEGEVRRYTPRFLDLR
ncbi:MAG: hypothetical protein ACQETO_00435 [Pseudomonadota bacterium]